MTSIQEPDLSRKLQRRFGIRGQEAVEFLSPEVVPVVNVADLTHPSETDFDFERACSGATQIAAGGAVKGHIQLINPTGSNQTITADAAIVAAAGPGDVSVRFHDTALTTAVVVFFRDRRVTGSPAGLVRRQTLAAATGDLSALFIVDTNTPVLIPIDTILDPGSGILIVHEVNNTTLSVTWMWSEKNRVS